jgi:hypothetical protein
METKSNNQLIETAQQERKYHEGIDPRKGDCGDAICIGGIELIIGKFNQIP